jgi:hypothetical protein
MRMATSGRVDGDSMMTTMASALCVRIREREQGGRQIGERGEDDTWGQLVSKVESRGNSVHAK